MQTYPCAERLPLVEQVHGCAVADPYRWLEDASAVETVRWLADQDDLWLEYAGSLPSRFRLRTRVRELSNVGSVSDARSGAASAASRCAGTRANSTPSCTSTRRRCSIRCSSTRPA